MQKSKSYPFDNDVTLNGGYLYTTNATLSSRLANERLTQATVNMAKLTNKTVIDVGCGDGSYTHELYKRYRPKQMVGVDASKNAIKIAQALYGKNKGIRFALGDIYNLSKIFDLFDVAIVRGVIHHVEYPKKALQAVSRIAKRVVVLEPNGYNPVLKIIEKVSLYHRIHKERSYSPQTIRRWLNEAGFSIEKDDYVGLVPFFCPDGMATFLKKLEKTTEDLPFFSRFLSAVYVVKAIKI